MIMRAIGAVAACVLISLALTACSSETDSAKPASQSSSESDQSDVPEQPNGIDGYKVHITNWEEYYDEPTVLAVKAFLEGYGASFNTREIHPELEESADKSVVRQLTALMDKSWKADRHLPPVNELRINSVDASDSQARVKVCVLYASFLIRESDDSFMKEDGDVDETEWRLETFDLHKETTDWVVSKLPDINDSECKGSVKETQ